MALRQIRQIILQDQIVEKWKSTNYLNWTFKIEMLLLQEEIVEAITETSHTLITTNSFKKEGKA